MVVVVVAKREEKKKKGGIQLFFGGYGSRTKVGRWEEKLLIHYFHDQHQYPTSEPNDQLASHPYINPIPQQQSLLSSLPLQLKSNRSSRNSISRIQLRNSRNIPFTNFDTRKIIPLRGWIDFHSTSENLLPAARSRGIDLGEDSTLRESVVFACETFVVVLVVGVVDHDLVAWMGKKGTCQLRFQFLFFS